VMLLKPYFINSASASASILCLVSNYEINSGFKDGKLTAQWKLFLCLKFPCFNFILFKHMYFSVL